MKPYLYEASHLAWPNWEKQPENLKAALDLVRREYEVLYFGPCNATITLPNKIVVSLSYGSLSMCSIRHRLQEHGLSPVTASRDWYLAHTWDVEIAMWKAVDGPRNWFYCHEYAKHYPVSHQHQPKNCFGWIAPWNMLRVIDVWAQYPWKDIDLEGRCLCPDCLYDWYTTNEEFDEWQRNRLSRQST